MCAACGRRSRDGVSRPRWKSCLFPLHLDIGLVWEPLLRKRMTTIGGAVIGGTLDISSILPLLPAPHAGSALLKAYRFLTAAPLYPERYDMPLRQEPDAGRASAAPARSEGTPAQGMDQAVQRGVCQGCDSEEGTRSSARTPWKPFSARVTSF